MTSPSKRWHSARAELLVPSFRWVIATVSVIAAVASIPFLLSLNNNFVSDDWHFLHQVIFKPTFADIWQRAFDLSSFWFFRPVQWLTTWVLYQTFELQPWGFHLASVLIHALNVLILAVLYRHLLRQRGETPATALLGSSLAALLFAVNWHHHEAVFWFSAINEPLSGFFQLLSLLLLLRATGSGRHRQLSSGLAPIAFMLGLMAKEGASVLPVIALLMIQPSVSPVPDDTEHPQRSSTLRRGLLVVPYFIVLGLWLLLSASYTQAHVYRQNIIFAAGRNWLESFIGVIRYFLGHYMDAHALLPWTHPMTLIVGGLLGLVAVIALWRRRQVLVWAVAWMILGSIPYILFTPFPSDRFLYLTGVPASLLIVETFFWIRRELGRPGLETATKGLTALMAGLIGLYLLLQISALFSLETEWEEAGDMGQGIIAQVRAEVADPEPGSVLCLDNLPDSYRNKYVFRNGSVEALYIAYARHDFQIRSVVQPMSNFHPPTELDTIGCSHLFRYDDETRQLKTERLP